MPNRTRSSRELSPAEARLLPFLVTHLTLAQIARRVGVSTHTTRPHTRMIYNKFGVNSRSEAIEYALETGLLTLPAFWLAAVAPPDRNAASAASSRALTAIVG